MIVKSCPFVFLPGSGGGAPDLSVFKRGVTDPICFETVHYPGWTRYVADDFSSPRLVSELATAIEERIPEGPIRIMGLSMGGHFGYAAALCLQERGREVAGFCAIDSFMIKTAAPTAGWKGRAVAEGLELVGQLRIAECFQFARSKFWRAFLRVAGDRVAKVLRPHRNSSWARIAVELDPILERELSMRLLVREVAPWLAALDDKPAPLTVPAVLLRTKVTAGDDAAWVRRCPKIQIHEINGAHHSLFAPENADSLRDAFVTATNQWLHAAADIGRRVA